MNWGAVEPKDSAHSRVRLDFGLRPAILALNEWAVPGLGGAFFVRQLSWACMGLRLADEIDAPTTAARIAEGLEAYASWIVVRRAAERVQDDRVQGKRKLAGRHRLSFQDVVRDGAYVTVPFRRAATRALPGLGFCEREEARFSALVLSQQGIELAELAFAGDKARNALAEWIKDPAKSVENVSAAVKQALLPELATEEEKALVLRQVNSDPRREALAVLLHEYAVESLADQMGRGAFLAKVPDRVHADRLATCFAFEDVRTAALDAAQSVSSAIKHSSRTVAELARHEEVSADFGSLADRCAELLNKFAPGAPEEAIAFCHEQATGRPVAGRIAALTTRAPMVFSLVGSRIDQGIGYTNALVADDGLDATDGSVPDDRLPVPRPLRRFRRLLIEVGEAS